MQRTLSQPEFEALKAKVLSKAPDGLKPDEFQRWAGPAMAQALGEAESLPPQLDESMTGRASRGIQGLATTFNPVSMVEGVYNTVRHPVDTAKSLWDAHVAQFDKAKEAANQGRYSEAVGHLAATVVPAVGPAAAGIGERMAETGDVARGVGEGLGLLAPFMAKYGLEQTTGPNPQKADLLRREAETTVSQKVLAPGNPAYRSTAQKLAPEVLSRGMSGSRAELQQLADEGMADAADKIDAAFTKHAGSSASGRLPVTPIVDTLDARIQELSPGGNAIPTAAARVAHLEKLRDYLKQFGNDAPVSALKTVRDDFYRTADAAKGYQGPDVTVPDVGWAAREAGGAIRQSFASGVPGLEGANADYSFFKRLGDVLDPAIGRPKNVVAAPSGVTGGQSTAGAIIGHAAAAGSKIPGLQGASALVASRILPAILEAKNSPEWQLATAAQKMKLADAIERGDLGMAKSRLVNILKANTAAQSVASANEAPR